MNRINTLIDTMRSLFEQQLLPRYQALSDRDQRVLLILALFLSVSLPLFGMILPLNDNLTAAREQLAILKLQAVEAGHLADRLQSGGGNTGRGDVMSTVDRLARSSGVRQFMTRIRPQVQADGGKALVVHMKDAPYKESVRFISSLAQAGLGLTSMKLQAADSPGHIHLQAIISGG